MAEHSHLYGKLLDGPSADVLQLLSPDDTPLTPERAALMRAKIGTRHVLLDNPEARRLSARARKPQAARSRTRLLTRSVAEATPALRTEDVLPLHRQWCAYMRDLRAAVPLPQWPTALLRADYHGALLRVVQARCPSRVGVVGVVVQETQQTFVLLRDAGARPCARSAFAIVPKRGTVFETHFEAHPGVSQSAISWQLCGDQLVAHAALRVTRKYKAHSSVAMSPRR